MNTVPRAAEGTPLTRHMTHSIYASLVELPKCGARPHQRCSGAVSHPDGYPTTIHAGREAALEHLIEGATAGLTVKQGAEVRAHFAVPVTREVRRALAYVLLRPADRY